MLFFRNSALFLHEKKNRSDTPEVSIIIISSVPSTSLTASTSSQKSEPENLVEKPRTSVKKIIRNTNGAAPVKRKKSGEDEIRKKKD